VFSCFSISTSSPSMTEIARCKILARPEIHKIAFYPSRAQPINLISRKGIVGIVMP
jgi:hypothetical protein